MRRIKPRLRHSGWMSKRFNDASISQTLSRSREERRYTSRPNRDRRQGKRPLCMSHGDRFLDSCRSASHSFAAAHRRASLPRGNWWVAMLERYLQQHVFGVLRPCPPEPGKPLHQSPGPAQPCLRRPYLHWTAWVWSFPALLFPPLPDSSLPARRSLGPLRAPATDSAYSRVPGGRGCAMRPAIIRLRYRRSWTTRHPAATLLRGHLIRDWDGRFSSTQKATHKRRP